MKNDTVYISMLGAMFLGSIVLVAILIVSPVIGYAAGWAFETLFPTSWRAVHAWLLMPDAMSGGQLGAFLGCFGGLLGRPPHSKTGK